MSTPQIIGLNSSATLGYLHKNASVTPMFGYGLRQNAPMFAKQKIVSVTGNAIAAGPAAGLSDRFKIPPYGVWTGATLHLPFAAVTNAAAMSAWGYVGMIKRVDLRARDKVMATLYPEDIIAWIRTLDDAQYAVWSDPNHCSVAAHTIATNDRVDIPLPFSYFERVSNAIYAEFQEPTELVVEYNPSTAFISADGTVVATPELHCNFLTLGRDAEAAMKKRIQAAGDAGVTRLQTSSYKEADKMITDNAVTTTVDITCPYALAWIDFLITDTTNSFDMFASPSTAFVTTAPTPTLAGHLTRVELLASGTAILDLTVQELRAAMNTPPLMFRAPQTTDVLGGGQHYRINFNQLKSALDQTGVLSPANMSNLQLRLTHPDSGAVMKITTLCRHYTFEAMSGRDGRVTVYSMT